MCLTVYLSITVVDKDVPCAVVFQVGDLQATGVANLGRLEGGIEGLDFHHCFGIPGLGGERHEKQTETLRSHIPRARLAFTNVIPFCCKHPSRSAASSRLHPAC